MAGSFSKIKHSPAQLFALVFGVVYALTGVLGFVVQGFGRSLLLPKETLIIFGVNPLHNGLHLAVGLVWIAVSGSLVWSKATNVVFGIVFAALAVAGFMNLLGFLGISGPSDPDNILHLATAAMALFFGTVGAKTRSATRVSAGSTRTAGAH